jgi:WXG100 family type VII secretion target
MATIKVDSAAMRDKKASFIGIANSIKNFTEEMTREIESTKSDWEGEAAEEYVRRFNELKPTFEAINQTIKNYADFLEKAAEEYDKVENANKSTNE